MGLVDRLNRILFRALIPVTAWLTKTERRALFGRPLLRSLAVMTLWIKRGRRQHEPAALASEWQKMFPSPEMVPVLRVEGGVAYAEIHTRCPYRGTGNVAGCHRMMEYDRRMLRSLGGQLVVLRSQAEEGVSVCEVVIGQDLSAFVGAHER